MLEVGVRGNSLEGYTKRSGRNPGHSPGVYGHRATVWKTVPCIYAYPYVSQMARYCLTGSRIAPTYRGLRPRLRPLRLVQPYRLVINTTVSGETHTLSPRHATVSGETHQKETVLERTDRNGRCVQGQFIYVSAGSLIQTHPPLLPPPPRGHPEGDWHKD